MPSKPDLPTAAELVAMRKRCRTIYTNGNPAWNNPPTWDSFTHTECVRLLALIESQAEELKKRDARIAKLETAIEKKGWYVADDGSVWPLCGTG